MYQILAQSQVTLNNHIGSSPESASNMRLFEATGIGTCLLTDYKTHLGQLFEVDREVVAYRSIDECVEKAECLIENENVRKSIAEQGQLRTLRDHTFSKRAVEFDALVNSLLHNKGRLKKDARCQESRAFSVLTKNV